VFNLFNLQISKSFPVELQAPVQQMQAYWPQSGLSQLRPLGNITWKKH